MRNLTITEIHTTSGAFSAGFFAGAIAGVAATVWLVKNEKITLSDTSRTLAQSLAIANHRLKKYEDQCGQLL